jgi:hypothetical protein
MKRTLIVIDLTADSDSDSDSDSDRDSDTKELPTSLPANTNTHCPHKKKKRRKRGKGKGIQTTPTTLAVPDHQGACSYAALNNLFQWADRGTAAIPFLPLKLFWNTLDKMNKYGTGLARDGTQIGYYNPKNINDMRLHWTVLMQMLSEIKGCSLKKCMLKGPAHGNWRDASWLCRQKTGLFLLFGYADDSEDGGHYVAMNAQTNQIIDSFTTPSLRRSSSSRSSSSSSYNHCTVYPVCKESLKQIFAGTKPTGSDPAYGAFDCAFQLTFL